MTFASEKSKTKSKSGKASLPDHQLIIKVPTSKGYVTLGKVGLYDESALHSAVSKLTNEQLVKLLSKAEASIVAYNNDKSDTIKLDI